MAVGWELSHGALSDRKTYVTHLDNPNAVAGFETAALISTNASGSSGPIILMSMQVSIHDPGGASVWVQVYDLNAIPTGATNAAQWIKRSKKFVTADADKTWEFPITAADEVEDQVLATRNPRPHACNPPFKDASFFDNMGPIKGFPFDKGIVVMLSNAEDLLSPVETGIHVTARIRYGAARGGGV